MTGGLEGTGELVRLALRRDRVRLPVWILALTGLTYFSGSSMGTTFSSQAAIDSYARTYAASPAMTALAGPPIALDTLAGAVMSKVSFIGYVGVALMALLEVVRHTRGEEEEGRVELLRSTVTGREAPGASATLVASAASVAVGLGVGLAASAAAVPFPDAMLYGASVAALGVVFVAIGLCLAQVFTHSRAASGIGVALFGLAFVVRGIGDVRGDALVWLSPMGWSQATHPLGDARWWPLLVPLVATGVLVLLARFLGSRRDLGGGLVAVRPGNDRAPRSLSGPFGLALRLQRANLAGWVGGAFALGAVYGSFAQGVQDMAAGNQALEDYFRAAGQGTFVDAFLATMLLVMALLAAAYAASSALRLSGEEASGRLEQLLATGLTRSRWMLGSLAVTVTGSAAVLLAGGLGLGTSYAVSVGEPGQALRIAALELIYLPAVLLLAALAALVQGWAPGAAMAVWVLLAAWFVLGYLGALLHPPDWLRQLSPFTHTPEVPVAGVDLAGPASIAVLCALLVGLGVVGLRRRDVV